MGGGKKKKTNPQAKYTKKKIKIHPPKKNQPTKTKHSHTHTQNRLYEMYEAGDSARLIIACSDSEICYILLG